MSKAVDITDFLPEGEKEPVVSNYMKLEQGLNRFRVLSSSITGQEYWETLPDGKRKPIRKRITKTNNNDKS
jgi:hypothetical protein